MEKIKALTVYDGLNDCEKKVFLGELFDFPLNELNSDNYVIFPGFSDVHVHLREPGFFYKESIYSGTLAAAHGGFTVVLTMPNLSPVPDSMENLNKELEIIERDAVVSVYPYGSLTVGEEGKVLSDMDALSQKVAAFSDDGKGVESEYLMREAMLKAKSLNKIVAAHCEVKSLVKGGYIHDGEYAKRFNHKGISSESEYLEVERDIRLAKETGCSLHICHVSTKESVALIRKAKKDGIDVTAETAPHYLVFDERDLKEDGAFKMNPPLRGYDDRLALIGGVIDGTIDMIATDHAPHAPCEKSKGLSGSLFGVVGLETAFPALYTYLVKRKVITLERLIDLLAVAPRKRFRLPHGGFSVWDLNDSYVVRAEDFLSKGKSTPFANNRLYGRNMLTVFGGKAVYKY